MATNKKPRKRYVRKVAVPIIDPMQLLVPMDKAERAVVMGQFDSALLAITSGSAPNDDDWASLADAINLLDTLIISGKLPADQAKPAIEAASGSLVAARDRYKAGRGMRLDGAGIQRVAVVVDMLRQCADEFTAHEFAVLRAQTHRRLNQLMSRRYDARRKQA